MRKLQSWGYPNIKSVLLCYSSEDRIYSSLSHFDMIPNYESMNDRRTDDGFTIGLASRPIALCIGSYANAQ